MLDQKGRDQRWQDKPLLIEPRAQRHAGKGDQRGVGLQHAFDIPLAVELAQSPLDGQGMAGKPADALARLCFYASVDGLIGVALHADDRGHDAAPRGEGWAGNGRKVASLQASHGSPVRQRSRPSFWQPAATPLRWLGKTAEGAEQ
jgi:hypothetical protein